MPDKAVGQPKVSDRESSKKHSTIDADTAGHGDWRYLSASHDLLGMQRVVGNRSVARMVALGGRNARAGLGQRQSQPFAPALVSRKASPIIQRAKFSELMAFWKQQELGQAPDPAPKGKQQANNLPPEPGAIPSDVAQDNPVLTGDTGGGDKSPVGGGSVFDQPSPLGITRSGGSAKGPGTNFDSLPSGMKGTGSNGGVLLTMSGSSTYDSSSDDSSLGFAGAQPVPTGQVVGNKTQVKYLETDQARDEFEMKVGGSITQGGQPYDTSAMYSKFKGDGFAIYVMSQDGRFYSTSHKIGLFHHSSFLGGGAVAGAGEIQVVGGTVQYITNKSGHYTPGDKELTQTLHALEGASGFSSAKLARLRPGGSSWQDPYPDGAAGFLRDNPLTTAGGNKDAIKYNVKPMESHNQGEDTSSVDTVRAILQSFVGAAKEGKLKKFNKPNPDFGKTFEDIKLLVLAEFGWSEADVTTYQAVLENWNNNRPIGAVAGSMPPVPSASLGSATFSSGNSWSSSPVSASASSGAPVDSDGRDYDAELEELLKTNPSPDWSALGLQMTSFGWGVVRGWTSWAVDAKHKVWLLKGEKTVDELE